MPRLEPSTNCQRCTRLADFRRENVKTFPDYFNAPVPSFGPLTAQLLIVGLAPGMKGANRTGRPFTGDYAGNMLYPTLIKSGLASGNYTGERDDKLTLFRCRITNAVRCVPPKNKPVGSETTACRKFLTNEINAMPGINGFLALGRIAHHAIVGALDLKQSAFGFSHGIFHQITESVWLADSYHCSRYNTNTGRLSREMFEKVLAQAAARLDENLSG